MKDVLRSVGDQTGVSQWDKSYNEPKPFGPQRVFKCSVKEMLGHTGFGMTRRWWQNVLSLVDYVFKSLETNQCF